MELSYLLALTVLVEAIVVFGIAAFLASRSEGEVSGACYDYLGSFNLDAGRMIKCSTGCKYWSKEGEACLALLSTARKHISIGKSSPRHSFHCETVQQT